MTVVSLHPADPDLVACLEELLQAAKAGNLIGYSGAGFLRNREIMTTFVGDFGPGLIGGLVYVQHKVVSAIAEREYDDE